MPSMTTGTTVSRECDNKTDLCEQINEYLYTNIEWVFKMVEKHAATDVYWRQVNKTSHYTKFKLQITLFCKEFNLYNYLYKGCLNSVESHFYIILQSFPHIFILDYYIVLKLFYVINNIKLS